MAKSGQVLEGTKEGTVLARVVVKNQYGETGTRLAARDDQGHFIRCGKTKVDPKEVTEIWQEQLFAIDDKDPDKKLKLQKLFDALYLMCTEGLDDPKNRMPAVKANEILMTRCIGKPSPSPETLEALKEGGAVKVIVVQAPAVQKMVLRDPDKKLLPEFAPSEVVTTNEPETT